MTVRLKDRLVNIRDEQSQAIILSQVQEWIKSEETTEDRIHNTLKNKPLKSGNFKVSENDLSDLYTIKDIQKLCIRYRLRFLDSYQYKGQVPQETLQKIKLKEQKLQTEFAHLKIVAPSAHFLLEDCNTDPLLFAKVNDHYYLLIDTWGNDMSFIRSIAAWPLRSIKNAFTTLVLFSGLVTFITPADALVKTEAVPIWHYKMLFFVYLLMILSIMATFFGFVLHKNFSVVNWNNKYFNT